MAYPTKWRTTIPSRKAPGSSLAGAIRTLRSEITERMSDLLGLNGNWVADPVVNAAERRQFIHWSAFTFRGSGQPNFLRLPSVSYAVDASTFGITGAFGHNMYVPVLLPRGAVLQDVYLSCSTDATSSISCSLRKIDATTGTPTEAVIFSTTVPSLTSQSNPSLALSLAHTIDATPASLIYYVFRLAFAGAGGAIVQGVTFVYDVTGLRFNV